MSIWRSWEYAAYQQYELPEPVLDIGCGDGQFFRLAWPRTTNVVGIDVDQKVADIALRSRVYRTVIVAGADQLPLANDSFGSVFANCSLEHMTHLPEVLTSIYCCLRPGGIFLLSVVTDKFLQWTTLPLLVANIGDPERAAVLQAEHVSYHNLVNVLPPKSWIDYLATAGFEILEHIPIVPEITSHLFLLLDQLWHLQRPKRGELGEDLHNYLKLIPHFPRVFRDVYAGVLSMEQNWSIGSGAIFLARRSN
jgi:SAM-dependent methyltransferase